MPVIHPGGRMTETQKNKVEHFFLNALLGISIAGNVLTLTIDLLLPPSDPLSVPSDIIFTITLVTAYFLRKRFRTGSVLMLTTVSLVTVLHQAYRQPPSTVTSLVLIMLVGFVISVMLKGRLMWGMHIITLLAVNGLFTFQYLAPALRFTLTENDTVNLAISFSILYFILIYAAAVLKKLYDKNTELMIDLYNEIQMRNNEIVAQNEELMQIQDHLHELNVNLEKKVNERTAQIQVQNEILIKYSYTNAHQLRGPVARLLGLAAVYDLDKTSDPGFFIHKMKEEAENIDTVIKKINQDLNENP